MYVSGFTGGNMLKLLQIKHPPCIKQVSSFKSVLHKHTMSLQTNYS